MDIFSHTILVIVSLNLDQKILFRGVVRWILDIQTNSKFDHMAGVDIDAIFYPEIKSFGYFAKDLLFAEILLTITESGGVICEKNE